MRHTQTHTYTHREREKILAVYVTNRSLMITLGGPRIPEFVFHYRSFDTTVTATLSIKFKPRETVTLSLLDWTRGYLLIFRFTVTPGVFLFYFYFCLPFFFRFNLDVRIYENPVRSFRRQRIRSLRSSVVHTRDV